MDADVVIVGAGVVGLAAAAALARAGRSVVVVERNAGIAREISARNSQVIHAGIYYPPGSLKATLCVAGRHALYARCRSLGIAHRRCGKLIVASSSDEVATLEDLQRRGSANGVGGLELVDGGEVARREPAIRAAAALVSPDSGIVDAHALSLSYLTEMEAHAGALALRTEVVAIDPVRGGYRTATCDDRGRRAAIRSPSVVNAAGLAADRVASWIGIDIDACGYRIHPCKGDYFSIAASAGVALSHLVYPVPEVAGLGIHVTQDVAGRYRLGPDAEYVESLRFDVDPDKAVAFAESVRRFLPDLERDWVTPDFAGIRPKLAAPGERFRDFVVCEESERGFSGFVNLIGIESPGLTAASAIADRVVALLAARMQ